MSNQQSSDLKVGDDVLWLSGPDAQVTSVYKLMAKQQLTLTGETHGEFTQFAKILFVPTFGDLWLSKTLVYCSVFTTQHLLIVYDK